VATKPWRFAPLRRAGVALVVVAVGAGAGFGAVALARGDSRPSGRPATPSVAAFRLSTQGPIGAARAEAAPEALAEPASTTAALEAFLEAERDGLTARSYRLLTSADQDDIGSAAAWAAGSADRPRPVAFTVTSTRSTPEGDDITVDVSRQPSLDPFAGFVSGRAVQVWRVVHEGDTWRIDAAPVSEDPVLPPVAAAADAAGRWVEASASCDRAAANHLQAVADLSGPADLLGAPCRERGAWTAAGPPTTLDRAPDTQALVEAYGPDVGSWARLVPVRGPQSHFFAALVPLGDDWRVIGVTSDGG
jgi:hypothetical protein